MVILEYLFASGFFLGSSEYTASTLLAFTIRSALHTFATIAATASVVFRGTTVIGWFSGKVTASGAKVEDFQGDSSAYRFVKLMASSLGVSIDTRDTEIDDWDISEFYAKTNPNGFDKRL